MGQDSFSKVSVRHVTPGVRQSAKLNISSRKASQPRATRGKIYIKSSRTTAVEVTFEGQASLAMDSANQSPKVMSPPEQAANKILSSLQGGGNQTPAFAGSTYDKT